MEQWGPLVPAVAAIWPRVVGHVSEHELSDLEDLVLAGLCAYDQASATAAAEAPNMTPESFDLIDTAARSVEAALRARPPLGAWLNEEFDRLAEGQERFGPAAAPSYWTAFQRSLLVPVMYATDRAEQGSGAYGSRRGALSYGQATVSVPDDRTVGSVGKPRWWRLQFRPDPVRDVVLGATEQADADALVQRVRTQLDHGTDREALVFVHGYNVTFADAARHAAQIAYDLNFTGVVLLYSWASKGGVLDYPADGDAARRAVPYFQTFLRTLLTRTGVRHVHIIAHSMGNRLLTDGLAGLDTTALPGNSGRLGHIVFAAPDVDRDVFRHLLPAALRQARTCTLYVSDKDRALAAARRLSDFPRAGQGGTSVIVAPGLDTVDVTELGTDILGHSYVGNHATVLADLHGLLRHGHGPAQRYGLARTPHPDGDYWSFLPQK
ncbi:alpha/beta hydrolase [Streptomyces sp. DSM 40750]|uniref:alpha/beta hydrolase n=1 Tax=Streptomyces sp. DSM 40750 TaxID=2801030 RepID=UPI00214A8F54|nr:alpha/beta hydrolase [Streptomyces sp. DSM 40750]UUU19291.1 alpha/beta hydrolase [Streptomyces sp. DSM 40750]UUU27366.1 alpha/beta hydrolase [Streptomyces sp. DSM 40750]